MVDNIIFDIKSRLHFSKAIINNTKTINLSQIETMN